MFYKFVYFLLWPFFKLILLFYLKNEPENFPEKRLIVCSNHLNLLDPFLVALAVKRQVHFLAKKELFDNKILAYLLDKLGAIPVDRQGIDLKAIKKSSAILKEDKYLGIFPEGTRVKEVKKENIKNGIGYIALRADSDILPLQIVGSYRPFSRIHIVFKPIISIDNYKHLDKKDAYNRIAEDVYESIYEMID